MIVYLTSEVARNHGINFPLFSTITRKAVVSSFEKNNYATAPIAFTLGIIFSLLFFSPSVAYTSIAILTLGDSAANIFGKIFGKTPLPFNKKKTVEGTMCGFVCALFGSILFIDPLNALIAVTAGMFAEAFSLPISENLSIPLTSGIILTIFSF
jgi:dolichol kinase